MRRHLTFLAAMLAAGAATAEPADPWALRGTAGPDAAPATVAEGGAPSADPAAGVAGPPLTPRVTGRAARAGPAQSAADPAAPLTGSRRRSESAPGPYDALGLRLGSGTLYPALEIAAGYTSNATGTAGGDDSATGTVSPELRYRSDWSRHEATLDLRGSFEHFADGGSADAVSASADAALRLDLSRDWGAELSVAYDYGQQELSDPDYPAGAAGRPGVHDLTAAAALERRIGPLRLRGSLEAERKLYEDAEGGSGTIDQGDRDFARVETRLRAGYELRGPLEVFAEAGWGRQDYDNRVSSLGYERDGTLLRLRGGLVYDSPPVLTGELAVGVLRLERDDPALSTLRALTVDGSVAWSPSRLVTVSLDLSTGIEPAAEPGSAGAILYDATLGLAYDLRDALTLSASAAVSARGGDREYTLGTGLTWRLGRSLAAIARYSHAWTDNADPATDSSTDAVSLGLRLQR